MQPAVMGAESYVSPFAPGLPLTALVLAAAVGTTLLAARVAGAPALDRLVRWLNPIVVATWLASVWMVGQRLLEAPSWAGLVAKGIMLSLLLFALLPLLRDFAASAVLALEGRVRVGDEVRVAGHEGRVVRLGLRSVVIQRSDRSEMVIPNHRFHAMTMVRLNVAGRDAICDFEVTFHQRVDVQQAVRSVAEAATLSPYAAPGRLPEVLVVAREGESIRVRVHAYVFDRTYAEHFRGDVLARLDQHTSAPIAHAEQGQK